MSQTKTCGSCGAELPVDAPAGHCPNCLLLLATPSVLGETTFSDELGRRGGIATQAPLRLFGDYELLEEIARGGMGVVYRARQRSLDRIVAVKMILSGQFASREYVQRFRAEASSAAMLQHPNIVAIHEVGVQEGQHFFSMDYVQGRTLAEMVREGPLPARRAATYLKTIAEAIHYAHGRGILHRDLKPSNVLIDAEDQPRITDFGLAKRLHGSSELTFTGQMLGSPNYMPPEQAGVGSTRAPRISSVASPAGEREDSGAENSEIRNPKSEIEPSLVTSAATKMKIGPASDVYGLGAILYHLLTGRPPFQGETMEQVLVQLREQDSVAPRLLNPSIPRDLETICLKCLEKDATRRYPTARGLSEELGRFLNGTPIRARPVNAPEKLWRWCRRNPALASLGIASLLLLLTVAIGAPIAAMRINRARNIAVEEGKRAEAQSRRAESQRKLAEAGAQDLRRTLYAAQMNLVQQAWNDGAIERAQALLRAQIPKPREEDLRGFEWRHFWGFCRDESAITITNETPTHVQSVAVSRDGMMIAFGGPGLFRVWRFDRQGFLANFNESSDFIRSIVFLPDGSRIACGYFEGTVRIWDLLRGEVQAAFTNLTGSIERVRVSRNGRWLGAAESPTGTIRLFDLERMREVKAITGAPNRRPALAFSPDGKMLAFGRGDQTVVLWDVERMTEIKRLSGAEFTVDLDFSPDGQWLAGAGGDSFVRLWNVLSVGEPVVLRGHKTYVSSVSFSPDGAQLATSCMDGTIKVWDVASRSELRTLRGHKWWVNNVVFNPDGTKLVSAADDETVKIWELKETEGERNLTSELDGRLLNVRRACIAPSMFSPDSKHLVTASRDNKILLWDTGSEQVLATFAGHIAPVTYITFSVDGRQIASGSEDQTVRVWDVKERQEVAVFNGHTGAVFVTVFSPDGRLLASAGVDGAVRLWDVAARTRIATFAGHREPVFHLVFTPDGRTLLSGSERSIRAWHVEPPEPAFEMPNCQWENAVAVSADGTTMAFQNVVTSSQEFNNANQVVLWDLARGRPRAILASHRGHVYHAAYSTDGTLIATASDDKTIKLWKSATGELLHTLTGHDGSVMWVAFSPDGRTLASASQDGTVRLWSLVSHQQVAALGPIGPFTSITFSPDGRVLAARGGEDGRIRLWHAPTFEEIESEVALAAKHHESETAK